MSQQSERCVGNDGEVEPQVVVLDLQAVVLEDWNFPRQRLHRGELWCQALKKCGCDGGPGYRPSVQCRNDSQHGVDVGAVQRYGRAWTTRVCVDPE